MFRIISTYLARLQKPAFSKSWVKTFLSFDATAICSTDKILSQFALCKTEKTWVLKQVPFLIALSDRRSWNYLRETLLSNKHQDACKLFETCILKLPSITGDSQGILWAFDFLLIWEFGIWHLETQRGINSEGLSQKQFPFSFGLEPTQSEF